ncbi:MAG: ECF transporter S component [Clostridiales bacterium]|jgi:uncharacterized membrane protein|nr:ECF transporter S component [Clostridiales bacterium]
MKTKSSNRTTKLVQISLLVAIILLMAFTPIGYIRTLGLEITLIVIPVTVGAIILGPTSGAILGAVFGATSFIQCFGMSPFGAALLAINPWATFILCMVPRVLMGWLSGLIYAGLKRGNRNKNFAMMISNLSGPLLNTLLFMTTLILFFYSTEFIQGIATSLGTSSVIAFVIAFVGLNGLIEAGACFVLGSAVSKALDLFQQKAGSKY